MEEKFISQASKTDTNVCLNAFLCKMEHRSQLQNTFGNSKSAFYLKYKNTISYGITKNEKQYPLDRNFGGIYSSGVTIFRSSESSGYALLDLPFQTAIVSVAAINRPELEKMNGQLCIAKHLIEPTKEKMRTILRIAGKYNHNAIVLSAFGCGAFCNPPEHIALLFKEVFAEPEFKTRFALIVFAIISDQNSNRAHNPNGNFEPFRSVF